ncbi:unnamed protein product [Paramecium sonneborni]|uniref:Uncharacterized protein n=1 Tax=Paramecium sonneborni TaxID=65129 RepID=A0A8S1PLB8_9CILI|nr:unnamed protein product [Paramecium sonneborni]
MFQEFAQYSHKRDKIQPEKSQVNQVLMYRKEELGKNQIKWKELQKFRKT